MATRKLTKQEREYNQLQIFLGNKAISINEFDIAKNECMVYFKNADLNIINSSYLLFLKNREFLDVELADYKIWRKGTDKFFNLSLENYPEGRKLLSILTSHEYCTSKYLDKWNSFKQYDKEISLSIKYIKDNIESTWLKLPKNEKKIKINRIRNKIDPFFDANDFLLKYGLNGKYKALLNKLDELELLNLHENNIYESSMFKISTKNIKKFNPILIKKIQKLFLKCYLKLTPYYTKF